MTGSRRRASAGLAAMAALLLPAQALAVSVTWTFGGVLDTVLDPGAHTTLSAGDTFTGRVYFDTEPTRSRYLFGFLGRHEFGRPHGLSLDLGDGFLVGTAADAPVTLTQTVQDVQLLRDRVTFDVPETGPVDAFGTRFLADGRNAASVLLNGADAAWLDGTDVVTEPGNPLSSGSLSLRLFEALTGDALRISGTVTAFAPVLYGADEGAAPVPIPSLLVPTLAAGLALVLGAGRRRGPARG